MVRVIAVLIFAVYCSGTSTPTLWGSRVVAQTSGPSSTMKYQLDGDIRALVMHDSQSSEMSIEGDKCVDDKKRVWGSPCWRSGSDVYVTMADVKAQESFVLIKENSTNGMALATYFVPQCKFPKPAKDEVDLNTSFPFSRFVKDMHSFNVSFAVQGAESRSNVTFFIDERPLCSWTGTELRGNDSSVCGNMIKDVEADLRVFHGVFPVKLDVSRESFVFRGKSRAVAVSIDYMQSGISPEVAECSRSPTTSKTPNVVVSLWVTVTLLCKWLF